MYEEYKILDEHGRNEITNFFNADFFFFFFFWFKKIGDAGTLRTMPRGAVLENLMYFFSWPMYMKLNVQ